MEDKEIIKKYGGEIKLEDIFNEEKLNAIDKFVEKHKENRRVFILEAHYYDGWDIYKICSTKEKVEQEKEKLEKKIQNIKIRYYLEYYSDYDEDMDCNYQDHLLETDDEKYDRVNDRIYTYQMIHSELTIEDIKITEHRVV